MEKKEKTPGELLQKELVYKPEHSGILMSEGDIEKALEFCEGYKAFLSGAKTERESVDYTVGLLEKNGYHPFDPDGKLKPGDKFYLNNRGKAILFGVIGTRPLERGVRIIASHIDSPRIDLKQRPLYEEAELALFKTHYYGGVRKYQWVAVPLALHGVIVKKDGETVRVSIGEDSAEPVFCIGDLLPHLGREQGQRTLNEGIRGEELNALVGSMPFRDEAVKEKVKLRILKLLNDRYGIVESDFLSAELSLVPAGTARDVGLDSSMVGGYGQDDRVCAYASIMASLDTPAPETTWVNILADKEEVGSNGNTGLQSRFLEQLIYDLAAAQGVNARRVLQNSECLSADVNAAFDPTFPDVSEKKNTAYLGYGACVTKYTGSGGKSGSSDASAEFVGRIRRLFDKSGVIWQTGELGKVDMGGGGTVAAYVANLGVDVIDIGVAVLSMHSPFEVVSKTDVYNIYKGFAAFLGTVE